MKRISICALLAVSLWACARSPSPEPAQANTFDQKLQSLSPPARNLGLRNAIRDSGAKCGRVGRSVRQQDYKASAMWVAHCTDTGDFALFVSPTGYAQVVRCDNLGPGVPGCRPGA